MSALCTHPILVQKEKIELTRSFYTQLLESDWFSNITIFGHITLFGNAYFSKNTNYGHNHYLVPFFKSLIQALYAYQAKGKVRKFKMVEQNENIFITYACLNLSKLPYLPQCPYLLHLPQFRHLPQSPHLPHLHIYHILHIYFNFLIYIIYLILHISA